MKPLRFSHSVLLFGAAFALLTPALARPVGKIRSVQPLVEARRGAAPWQPVKDRFSMEAGQVIRSGPKGKATLTFNDGTEVVMNSKAQVAIEGEGNATQPLALRVVGSLSMIFVRAKGPMEIRTAAGVAAVTGTEYIISLLDDNTTQLTVVEGGVRLFNAQGSVLVAANQQSTAKVGEKPSTPVAVDTSGLMQWTFDVAGLPVEFETPLTAGSPGMRALAAGDFAAADTELTEAARLAPADAAILTALGTARRQRGDANGAITAFQEAIRLAPANDAPRLGLALSELARNDIGTAREALQNAPDTALIHAARGLVALRANDTTTATQALETAIQREPNTFQAHALLALTRLSQNQNAQAMMAGRRAVEIAPQSAQAQASLALALFYSGQTSEAVQAATRAVRLNPNSPFALLAQGEALLARHDSDGAKRAFMQAEALAPNLPLIHLDLGAAYTRLDLPVRAEKAFRRALQLVPNSAAAHTGLGAVLQGTGRWDAALPELQRALELEPDNAVARGNLAAYYIEMGDFSKAEAGLTAKFADDPANGLLYIRLSEASLFKQRLFKAQEYALKAVRLLPGSAQAHYQLGRVYRELDRIVQAEQAFRQAVILDNQFAAARFALGLAQEAAQSSTNLNRSAIASQQSGPRQALNIQNLQTPGAQERIQAAIQDPSVLRSASRSFGDTQIEGSLGEGGVNSFDLSHLRAINNRRGAFGVTLGRFHTDGVRAGADLTQEKAGVNWGSKQQDSASGFFALAQFERNRFGDNTDPTPLPPDVVFRHNKQLPLALVGFNRQTAERQRTRGLLQFDSPKQDSTTITGNFLNTKGRSVHGEVRHDLLIGEKHSLSAGLSLGNRRFDLDTFFKQPPGLPFPDFQSTGSQRVQTTQIYIRDEARLTPKLTAMAEIKVERLGNRNSSLITSPPGFPPRSSDATQTVGLPNFVATYQLAPASTVRLRARGLFGTVEDFSLLAPTDVFLFGLDGVPDLAIGARGRSYEAEFSHTFGNASFLRLGAFQQNLNVASGTSETLTDVQFRALRVRYEGVLSNSTTFFVNTDFNDAKGTIDFTDFGFGIDTNYRLTRVPKFAAEIGVQYLAPSGWFARPSFAYAGSRLQPFVGTPRDRLAGFGLVNFQVGKRSGLRSTLFVEVTNLFNKSYLGNAGFLGEVKPGRQFRFGAARRF